MTAGRAPQIDALTGLRGAAALLVVGYHMAGGFLPHLAIGPLGGVLAKGYLAVDLFFLLSGFVMAHVYGATFREGVRRPAYGAFVLARFARVYPLHLALLLAFVALETVKLALLSLDPSLPGVAAFSGGRSLAALAAHLTLTHAAGFFDGPTWNGPAWSIGAEWFAYLLFPAIVAALALGGATLRILLVLAAFAGLYALTGGGSSLDRTYVGGLWRCLAEFTLGVLLHEVHASGRLRALGGDRCVAVLAALLLLAALVGVPDLLVLPLIAALIPALAGGTGRASAVLASRPALFLGAVSYALYMVHMLMIEGVNLASRAMTHQPLGAHLGPVASASVLVLGSGLAVGLAALLHRHVERPARAAMKRRAGPGRAPSRPAFDSGR